MSESPASEHDSFQTAFTAPVGSPLSASVEASNSSNLSNASNTPTSATPSILSRMMADAEAEHVPEVAASPTLSLSASPLSSLRTATRNSLPRNVPIPSRFRARRNHSLSSMGSGSPPRSPKSSSLPSAAGFVGPVASRPLTPGPVTLGHRVDPRTFDPETPGPPQRHSQRYSPSQTDALHRILEDHLVMPSTARHALAIPESSFGSLSHGLVGGTLILLTFHSILIEPKKHQEQSRAMSTSGRNALPLPQTTIKGLNEPRQNQTC